MHRIFRQHGLEVVCSLRLLIPRGRRLGVPAASEAASESSQLTGLVHFDVLQRLGARVPENMVPRVLGRLVHGQRACCSAGVGGPVGQLHDLREHVGAARSLYYG